MATAKAQHQSPYAHGSGAQNVVVTPSSKQQSARARQGTVRNPRGDSRTVARRRDDLPRELISEGISRRTQQKRDERFGKVPRTVAAGSAAAGAGYVSETYIEEQDDQTVRRQLPGQEKLDPYLIVKAARTSWMILMTTLPFWAIQFVMVKVGLIGLGLVGLANIDVRFSDFVGAQSLGEFLSTIVGGIIGSVLGFANSIIGFTVGYEIQDIGFAIYLATSIVVFLIGMCSCFYAWFMYVLNGINPLKGAGGAALFLSLGLYYIPLIQLFPWVVLFVVAVWWAHRKA